MLSTQLNDGSTLGAPQGGQPASESSESPRKGRSESDGSQPVLSPSPKFREPEKRTQDDLHVQNPTTPRRPAFPARGLSLQMPPRDLMSANSLLSPAPLSPKLDHSNTYGSPVGSIPRRSRGLDFSRAATNLHHSTLAEQSSPDASPTMTGRAMNIPHRRSGQFSIHGDMQTGGSGSLWSTLANTERNPMSSSLGSVNMMGSDSSGSSSGDEDLMDADDIDESILTTPQIKSIGAFGITQSSPGNWITGPSPAVSSLMNFQNRNRLRSGKNRKSTSSLSTTSMNSPNSRSPPTMRSIEGIANSGAHHRRESISWAANQLHISGSESDDGTLKSTLESSDGMPNTPNREGQRGVIRRAVTRRGNMLPKTKGFARIRAALADEGAPVETEVRREADVIRQVRESDRDLEPTRHPSISNTAQSSPMFGPSIIEALDDIPEDDIMGDSSTPSSEPALSSSFKQHAMKNSKGFEFWDTFDGDTTHTPPPPPFLPRGSSSGISDDMSMYTPPLHHSSVFQIPSIENADTRSSSGRSSTPQPSGSSAGGPSTAEITRKVNNKRRRDDDLDPSSFKRRAVSPGMSTHNSPVAQSPMQRDVNPWGTGARTGTSSSNNGSVTSGGGLAGDKATTPSSAAGGASGSGGSGGGPKRVGFQGMADTHDGLMKMSIE